MVAHKPLTPEMLVPRLGEYLVAQGHISETDLHRALKFQRTTGESKQRMLLGETLVEMEIITRDVLDQAITEQIIQLRSALENANRYLERRVQERTAELKKALERLSELSQLKADFVANISHELRTPLTHVRGYLELMVDESLGPITEKQLDAIKVSQKATERLESLIENLFLFAQSEQSGMSIKLAAVDLKVAAEKIFSDMRSMAEHKQISMVFDINAVFPNVQADKEKISWVIMQLLDNAIKFTPVNGKVTLSIQYDSDNFVNVAVTDTGIGIPKNQIDEIFEPFHQLDGSSSRKYGGTGLGLTLVKEILSAHGSLITVDSELGKGSTFRFPLLIAPNISKNDGKEND